MLRTVCFLLLLSFSTTVAAEEESTGLGLVIVDMVLRAGQRSSELSFRCLGHRRNTYFSVTFDLVDSDIKILQNTGDGKQNCEFADNKVFFKQHPQVLEDVKKIKEMMASHYTSNERFELIYNGRAPFVKKGVLAKFFNHLVTSANASSVDDLNRDLVVSRKEKGQNVFVDRYYLDNSLRPVDQEEVRTTVR